DAPSSATLTYALRGAHASFASASRAGALLRSTSSVVEDWPRAYPIATSATMTAAATTVARSGPGRRHSGTGRAGGTSSSARSGSGSGSAAPGPAPGATPGDTSVAARGDASGDTPGARAVAVSGASASGPGWSVDRPPGCRS